MARIKGGLNAKKKHNRVLKLAKGYRGARSNQYRVAKQSVMRALTSSYSGRKERKREFRKLWITRINAAARINGLSYSKFMFGLKKAGVDMNRKMLAELAVNDAEGFAALAEMAKKEIAYLSCSNMHSKDACALVSGVTVHSLRFASFAAKLNASHFAKRRRRLELWNRILDV